MHDIMTNLVANMVIILILRVMVLHLIEYEYISANN